MPPRSEPITGMPLIIASTATSGWFSHHSEGISSSRVSARTAGDRWYRT